MKRAVTVLLSLLLLCACRTQNAPAQNAAGTSSTQPRKATDSAVSDSADEPSDEADAETVVQATEQAAQRTPPEVPPEPRFPGKFSETPVYGERSYRSSGIDVTIRSFTVEDTYAKICTYHVADVYVKDVTSIRTAAAYGDFNTRYVRKVRDIAVSVGALFAIDGDSYARVKKSFVIRNGELYRDTLIEDTDLCVLYRDGRMETKKWGTFTMQEIIDSDPWQVWGFGPALLDEDGHAIEIEHALSGHNPRAAIGYYEPGHYCFVVVDGRIKGWSEGIRLSTLSKLMEDLGCKAAYNLDGGGSAQMFFNGEIISRSCNEDRVISDIIYLLPEE
jgi:hypothetical protein